jgi:hypothetical protein
MVEDIDSNTYSVITAINMISAQFTRIFKP